MRTALDVATARAVPTPIPTVPPPPGASAPWFEPPASAAAAMASVNGGNVALGRRQASEESARKLAVIQEFCPEQGDELVAFREDILQRMLNFHTRIESKFAPICELEQNLIGRAAALKDAAAMQGTIDESRRSLDGPGALDLSGEAVAALTNRLRVLPTRIAEAKQTALEYEIAITRLSQEYNISIEEIVRLVTGKAQSTNGRDPDLYAIKDWLPLSVK